MTKISMFLKTTSTDYDDRVRKECQSLVRLGAEVDVYVVEDANEKYDRTVAAGYRIHARSLMSERLFPGKSIAERTSNDYRMIKLKFIEMYLRYIFSRASKADVYWFHESSMTGLLPVFWLIGRLLGGRKLIWDMHELPERFFLNNPIGKFLFWLAVTCADTVIVCNRHRADYLTGLGIFPARKAAVLHNLVDRTFLGQPRENLPGDIQSWLGGGEYIFAQNGASATRCFEQLVRAVQNQGCYKLISVGPYSTKQQEEMRALYGQDFDGKVKLIGWTPQFEMIKFIDHAVASIVMYEDDYPPRKYCEPNRLYQALGRGTPVIVGNNPPMAEFVEKHGVGVVLASDGRNWQDVLDGITRFRHGQAGFSEIKIEDILWEEQDGIIARCIAR